MQLETAQQPAKKVVKVVYGYILGLQPNTVIGVQRDGKWFLPGGPVEGDGAPVGVAPVQLEYDGDPVRSAAVAWHLKQQTGLRLVRLSLPFQVMTYDIEDGLAIAMLYLASAEGGRTAGSLVTSAQLPEFAVEMGVQPEQIRRFLNGQDPTRTPVSLWQRIKRWFGGAG
jgi:hypothetical protein